MQQPAVPPTLRGSPFPRFRCDSRGRGAIHPAGPIGGAVGAFERRGCPGAVPDDLYVAGRLLGRGLGWRRVDGLDARGGTALRHGVGDRLHAGVGKPRSLTDRESGTMHGVGDRLQPRVAKAASRAGWETPVTEVGRGGRVRGRGRRFRSWRGVRNGKWESGRVGKPDESAGLAGRRSSRERKTAPLFKRCHWPPLPPTIRPRGVHLPSPGREGYVRRHSFCKVGRGVD